MVDRNALDPAGDVPARASLKVIEVESVRFQNDTLLWRGPHHDGQIDVKTVVFVLPDSKASTCSTVVCLKEPSNENESSSSYELLLLRCKSVPEELRDYRINQWPAHLSAGSGRRIDIIVSVKSGTGLALGFWEQVLQPIWNLMEEELGGSHSSAVVDTEPETKAQITITQSSDSVSQFARGLSPSRSRSPHQPAEPRTVILLSGDGGVSDLLNGLDPVTDGPLLIMAILPFGTGNALFHSLHKPLYAEGGPSMMCVGLRTLFKGSPANLPVFRASFSQGAHLIAPGSVEGGGDTAHARPVTHLDGAVVASYGFHASLIYESDTPAYRVHGDKRFGMVAQELLRESKAYTAHVEIRRPGSAVPESIEREQHGYILTTPLSNLERTFTISPASRPLDGQLRTVHFGNIGGERAMEAMTKAYDGGKHVNVEWDDGEKVYYEDVDEITITIEEEQSRWRMVCIDGTIVEIPRGGQMSVARLETSPIQVVVDQAILNS